MSSSDLTIAVPRGALFEETLDWLERLGVATGEVRTNDRKLLFDDVGLITMRPRTCRPMWPQARRTSASPARTC